MMARAKKKTSRARREVYDKTFMFGAVPDYT